MKKNVLTLLFVACSILAFKSDSSAQTLIHYWHFNNYSQGAMHTPTINAIAADFTAITGSNANILYKTNTGTAPDTYIDSLQPVTTDYDTVNARMGQPSGGAIRARNPSDSMKLYFYLPSTGYKNLTLKYGTELSSLTHGMLHQNFDYSTDGGTSWKTSGLSETSDAADTAFKLVAVTFTDTTANNNANLVFRITFSGNDTGTQGNNRFDNVTLEGTAISGSSTAVAVNNIAAAYTMFPNPVTNNLQITGATEGLKYFSVTNQVGQNVYAGNATGKNFTVNTSGFAAGSYFISVRDNNSGQVNTMKFIKQ